MSWYISLTLRWSEQQGSRVNDFLDYCQQATIPNDRIRVPRISLHSTLFAFACIERPFFPHKTMHGSARHVLSDLLDRGLGAKLRELPQFRFRPSEVRHYSKDSTVQFELENDTLTNLRTQVSNAVGEINHIFPFDEVKFPFDGGPKNAGGFLWGSIARNPANPDENVIQQLVPISDELKDWIVAKNAILTISDESLGNTLQQGDFTEITLQ